MQKGQEDNQKLQVHLSEAYKDKQQLATNNPKLLQLKWL